MLDRLKPIKQKTRRRVGRGYGSSKGGHTTGRGQKGQKSRAGYSRPRPGFEGGSMPLSRRIPKRRGVNQRQVTKQPRIIVITLSDLDNFKAGSVINEEMLIKEGFVNNKSKLTKIKILANGEISKKLTIDGVELSGPAKRAIEKAGGKILDK